MMGPDRGSPSSVAAQCSPSRSPSPLLSPTTGATDTQLRDHAAKLRISLSPPPTVHLPPGTDPMEIANLGPPPDEPRPIVHGAAAGEGEAGGVSRDAVEAEPGTADSRPGDVKEDGPGPGTGGKDDHCGPHQGIGVGMPKTDRPKMANQHDASAGNNLQAGGDRVGEGGAKDGGGGKVSSGGSIGEGSGSVAGYGADGSASSSAEKSRSVEHSSRSRSMAPEPEVTPRSPKAASRSGPTARRPRRPPGKDEQGGNMLPPSARGEHHAPAPPEAMAAPEAGPSSGGSAGNAPRLQDARESSSAGNELEQRFNRMPASHHHHHHHHNPSHQSSGVEMRDSTGAYVSVARAPGRQVTAGHAAAADGPLAQSHPMMSERWGNVGEQNREVAAAVTTTTTRDGPRRVGVRPAHQRATSAEDQGDTSGTEGWFRTLNYHYRPPLQTSKSKGQDQSRTSPEEPSGGYSEADSRVSPRAMLGNAQQNQEAGHAGRSSAGEGQSRGNSAEMWREPAGVGAGASVGWEGMPDHVKRALLARLTAGAGAEVGPDAVGSRKGVRGEVADSAAGGGGVGQVGGTEDRVMRRGDSRNRRSEGVATGRASMSVQSKREVESGEIVDGMDDDDDDDDEDVTFREIVDDLTVQNKLLKSRLRRYEPAKQPKGIKKERLFEVRFFEGMPADRRRELEGFLTAFVQTLQDQTGQANSAQRSVSRSMPSVSAIHNSTGDERLNSSGGEASDPRERPPPVRDGPAQGGTGSDNQQPVIRQVQKPHDSGYGSRASMSGNSAYPKGAQSAWAAPTAPGSTTPGNGGSNEPRSTAGIGPAQPATRTSREKPRRSDQDRLAAPSFSGFEPPSATGTGSGMKVSPPLEATMDWDEETKPDSKRTEFEQMHGTGPGVVEKAKAIAAAVERLFSQSAIIAREGPASGDTDPMPLPDQAGTNQAYLRNLLEASGSKGWIYLNLAIGMAQLHRFHVARPFIQDALRAFAPTVDVSPDGKKVRRKPGLDSATDPATSDGQGIDGSTGNVSSARDDTATTGKSSDTTGMRATTMSRPTEGSTAQTSMEPSKAGSKTDPAGEGSFSSSVPIVKEPDYRLAMEKKETPAFKRVKTSEELAATSGAEGKAGLSDESTRGGGMGGTSAYVPLFNHGADGDSDEGSPFDLSSCVYSDALNEIHRRDAGEGTLSFFTGGKFYSDLSAEPPATVDRTGSRSAEAYTVGLKGDEEEDKSAVPTESQKSESTFLRRPGPAFERALAKIGLVEPAEQGEEALLSFEVGHMDETERATIQLEALAATGMTNLNISDNFSLIVTLAYIRAQGPLAERKRKYWAIDLSPAADLEKLVRSRFPAKTTPSSHHFGYRPIYERPISHLPSSRPRLLSQAFTAGSDGSDEDEDDSEALSGSGPRGSIESDEVPDGDEAPRRRFAGSPGGDYNLSLQYPFIWSRSAGWDPSQDSHSSAPEEGGTALFGHKGDGRRRRFDDDQDGGDEPLAKRARWGNTSALATPSAVEEEYTPMDVEPDAYVD